MTTSQHHAFTVESADAGARLDRFLATRLAPVSRNRVKDLIKAGHATMDGAPHLEPNTKVRDGQQIAITVPEAEDADPEPEDIPLDVVFEDAHLVVINKPAGMVVHPAAGNWTGTLVNALLHHCAGTLSGIGGVKRPGIVHRIDKDTSGLLVVAKTDPAHQSLSAQFAAHGADGALQRAYDAIVWKVPAEPRGRIETGIARAHHNRLKMAVTKVDAEGARFAATNYTVKERFGEPGDLTSVSLVSCELETGRTHQIRVHMAHIGHPLLGDGVYGASHKASVNLLPANAAKALGRLRRQALHARLLGFRHPETGDQMTFEVDPPADMKELLKALKSWN